MTTDFQLAHSCPHVTMEEPVTLQQNRRVMPTRQPVAGLGLIRVLANDEVVIPQGGLYVPAQLSGGDAGPFHILPGEGEFLVHGSTESVRLDLAATEFGRRLQTDDFIRLFRPLAEAIIVENVNGFLVFTDTAAVGRESSLQVEGCATSALGFGLQQGARGRMVYPGWHVYAPPDQIETKWLRFNSPIYSNPRLKVTYATPQWRCLRCQAQLIENDYRFDEQGRLLMIRNENLLHQAALKILLTTRGTNPYFRQYGTKLKSMIGMKAISGTAAAINEDVRAALVRFQGYQAAQAKYQRVSNRERLYSIQSVRTIPRPGDPTTFLIDIVAQNASSQPINISIVFTVPGVVSRLVQDGEVLAQIGDKGTGVFPALTAGESLARSGRKPAYLAPPQILADRSGSEIGDEEV